MPPRTRTATILGSLTLIVAVATLFIWRQSQPQHRLARESIIAAVPAEPHDQNALRWTIPPAPMLGSRRAEVVAHLRSLSPEQQRAALGVLADALQGLDAAHFDSQIYGLSRDLATLAFELDDLTLMAMFYEFGARHEFPDTLRFHSLSQLGWVYLYSPGEQVANYSSARGALEEALSIAENPPVGLVVRPDEHLDILRKLAYLDAEGGDHASAHALYALALERVGGQVSPDAAVQLMKDAARQAAQAGDPATAASFAEATLERLRANGGIENGMHAHWAAETVSLLRLSPSDPRYAAVLERVVLDPTVKDSPSTLITRVMLARSYEAQGQTQDAVALLEETFQRFAGLANAPADLVWPYQTIGDAMSTVGYELSRALRKQGASAEAEAVESEVVKRYPGSDAASDIRSRYTTK